jgi:hypothetical protein
MAIDYSGELLYGSGTLSSDMGLSYSTDTLTMTVTKTGSYKLYLMLGSQKTMVWNGNKSVGDSYTWNPSTHSGLWGEKN